MRKRVFSGARPTGRLHVGTYLGALQNWVALQEEFDCIYCAVDVHALTTMAGNRDVHEIQSNIWEMILDWLAAGLDPERSTLFVQSSVPEHAELHLLFSMVTPLPWPEGRAEPFTTEGLSGGGSTSSPRMSGETFGSVHRERACRSSCVERTPPTHILLSGIRVMSINCWLDQLSIAA